MPAKVVGEPAVEAAFFRADFFGEFIPLTGHSLPVKRPTNHQQFFTFVALHHDVFPVYSGFLAAKKRPDFPAFYNTL
jgi:hypothetical protein